MSIQTTQVHGPGSGVMAGTAAQQKRAQLVDAAQKFEGMMMQELLKPMQSSQSGSMWGGEDDPDRDGSLDTMSSYGTEAVANALAAHGGMGIARQVVSQVTRLDQQMHGQHGVHHGAVVAGAGTAAGGSVGLLHPLPGSGPAAAFPLGSAGSNRLAGVSLGRTGAPVSEKEQKGTPQVLKFGNPPPMR